MGSDSPAAFTGAEGFDLAAPPADIPWHPRRMAITPAAAPVTR
ncbi:hypothetical protein AB0C76_39640 [Kitasatospora sp. NPDC048722]